MALSRKRLLIVAAALATFGCGKDAIGPLDWDHTCDTAKLDILHTWFGADYSPTPQLMEQPAFNFGDGQKTATFTVQSGQCVATHNP